MENRNIENIMTRALKPSFEPDASLNESIMKEIHKREKTGKSSRNGVSFHVMKAAALILAITFVGTAGVYAATKLLNKSKVTENGISTGGDYLKDEDLATPIDEVTTEALGKEEPSANDKWLSKETILVSGTYENIYYTYPDYLTMVKDTGFENNFNKLPGKCTNAEYVVTDLGDNTTEHSLNTCFTTSGGGSVILDISYIEGNIADDASYGVKLNGTSNVRDYTTPSGLEFTLVDDEVAYDEYTETRTTTLLSYGKYNGELHFTGMSEEEIKAVLDLIIINSDK